MALKTWILDDPITPTDMNRLEQGSYFAKVGGTTTGNGTNYVLTLEAFTLSDLMNVYVKIHADSLANATLNINGTGAYPFYTSAGQPLTAGVMKAGSVVHCVYSTTTSRYYVLTGNDAVNRSGDVMTGNLGVNSAVIQNFTGRNYVTVKGSTDAGVLELSGGAADANAGIIGVIQAADVNSVAASKNIANIVFTTSGATANNRGGSISFWTKVNGVSGTQKRLEIYDTGVISTQYNTIDDGFGNMILKNGSGVYGYTTGGATRKLVQVNPSDQVEIGVSGTATNLAGSSNILQGHIETIDANERRVQKNNATAWHGMFVSNTGTGLYDWKNSRTIVTYSPVSNTIQIGEPTTATAILGTLTVNGQPVTGGASGYSITSPNSWIG